MNKRNVIITIISVLILSCLLAFARTTTTDLTLVKPTWSENIDILDDLNANSDLLEAFANDPLEFDSDLERLEDRAGAMWTGNTETGITIDYQDADNTIDAVIGANNIVESMIKFVNIGNDEEIVTRETSTGDFEYHTLAELSIQPLDTALTNISALVYVSPSFIKLTANDTYAVRTLVETLSDIGAEGDLSNEAGLYAALSDVSDFVQSAEANSIDSAMYVDASIDHEHLAPDVISGMADVTSTDADYIFIWDATDSALKKCDMAEVRGAGGGETNTVSNVGTGAEVYKQKTGVDFELRKMEAGSNQIGISWYTEGSFTLKESFTAGGDSDNAAYTTYWRGMTFTTTSAHNVKKISLSVKKAGSPADDLHIAIRATSAGMPTGADLATGTILASNMTGSMVWLDCVLDTIVDLTDATKYAIIMSSPSSSSGANSPYMEVDTGNGYADGQYVTSSNSGVDWSDGSWPTADFYFKIYSIGLTYKDQIEIDVNEENIKLDDLGAPDDNTDLNASTSAHGLLKKLDNNAGNFMNGQGNWVAGGYTNLTSFIEQTAWRVFYSNTDGDVTELALGADGTYLGSNGATSAPTFTAPSGAGDMLKAVYDTDQDGDVDVSSGGTEKTSWTQYCIPYLSGTQVFGEIPIGTAEYALTVAAGATGYDWTLLQTYDAALTSVSGLTYVSPSFIKLTANDTYAVRTITETVTDLSLDSDDLSDVASITMLNEAETIAGNWVNTTHPWADNEVANDITINLATLATTFTCTDNESEALACPIIFVDGATGAQGGETDDTDFTYTPSTGNLSATQFEGIVAANLVDKSAAETISGNWVNTTNPWADNEITNDPTITIADTTDTTSFPLLAETITGAQKVKSDAGLTYNAGTGMLGASNVFFGKFDATAAPVAATDDITLGYVVGSIWIDVTNDDAYTCLDNTDGAAVWSTVGGINFLDLTDTPAAYDTGKYAKSTASGIIWDTSLGVDTYGTPVANDFAKFTDLNTIEGRSYSETRTDLGLVIGTNVLAEQTIGIADNNLVEIDHASVADNDIPKFTANGLEGRSYSEARKDLSNYIEYPQDYATGAGTVGDPWAGDCIQDAVDAVADGGIVHCRAGHYEIGANTLWYSEGGKTWSLIGDGIEETIIKTTSATEVGIYIHGVDHCVFKGFTLDADTQNADSASGITISESDYTIVQDVEVKNSGQAGINITKSKYLLLYNIYAHNNYSHGVHANASNTANTNTHNTYRDIYAWSNGQTGLDDYGYANVPTTPQYNVYDNIQCWDNTKHGIAICHQTDGVISNCSVFNNTERGFYLHTIEDFNVHDCILNINTLTQLYLNNSKNINFTNVISKNADNNASAVIVDDSHGVSFTSCQFYDDRGSPLQEYALVLTGTNTDIDLLNCKLAPNVTGEINGTTAGIVSWGIVNDDVDLVFGNGYDWKVQYDEAVDNQLLFITTGIAAGAITDPMFEIIVGATPTANQQVFGVAKGTQSSNTALFWIDEDGDAGFAGTLTGYEPTLTDEASLYSTLSDVSLFLEDTIDDTSPELGGELDAGAHSIGFTQQAVSYNSGTTTIDWKLSNKASMTFGAGNITTFAFTNPTNPCNVLLMMIQDGTGSRVVTNWDADIKWVGGTAPTLTTTANGIDIISGYWNGTNYFCVASLAFATP